MPALIARLALGCLLPVAVLLGLGAMPGLGYAWDFANAAGVLGACLLGLLFVIGGRPQPRPLYEASSSCACTATWVSPSSHCCWYTSSYCWWMSRC